MDYDLVIIGGGLAGSALAYYAARAGMKPLLLEQECLGAGGATRASRGIVRVYDPDPVLMAWNQRGLAEWKQLAASEGLCFVPCGVLYLIAPSELAQVRQRMAMFPDWGRSVAVLEDAQLRQRFAWLAAQQAVPASLDGAQSPPPLLGLYEAGSGYCEPRHAAQQLGMRARQLGATILEGAPVSAIEESGDGVRVTCSPAEFSAAYVVIAAGAASRGFLPAEPAEARGIALSTMRSQGQALNCCLIDSISGGYARPEGAGHIFHCGGEPLLPGATTTDLHQGNRRRLARAYAGEEHLIPVTSHVSEDLYTSDFRPLLPQAGIGRRRVLPFTGFSGRGAKYIPAAARELAGRLAYLTRPRP
jgi:glycine/D-amino acid oxidase-like deaminating enzyme